MKNKVCILVVASIFFCTLLSAQENQSGLLKQVEITIEGMACQAGCADAINKNLEKIQGVTGSSVSFANGKALVSYDPKTVKLDAIKAAITGTKVKEYRYTITHIIKKE